jgi:hypothetical protein
VSASPYGLGAKPYWPDALLKRHIRPAALAAGTTKHIRAALTVGAANTESIDSYVRDEIRGCMIEESHKVANEKPT